jgi:hypothetical protein
MFTRIVEVTTKPGKSSEVANAINEKILPFLTTTWVPGRDGTYVRDGIESRVRDQLLENERGC